MKIALTSGLAGVMRWLPVGQAFEPDSVRPDPVRYGPTRPASGWKAGLTPVHLPDTPSRAAVPHRGRLFQGSGVPGPARASQSQARA